MQSLVSRVFSRAVRYTRSLSPLVRTAGVLSVGAFCFGVAAEKDAFSDLEARFRKYAKDGRNSLSIPEFFVLLVPEYLRAEAEKKFIGRPADFFSPLLREAVDHDNNGLVDLGEFVFLSSLLQVPHSDIELTFRLFDEDGSGDLDMQELLHVMEVVKGTYRIGPALTSLKMPSLFPKGKSQRVTAAQFAAWATNVKKEAARVEFSVLDGDGDGKITLSQLGEAALAYSATQGGLDRRLDGALKALKEEPAKVSFDEFWSFVRLVEELPRVDDAARLFLASGDERLTRPQFRRAILAATDIQVPEVVLDVLFALFGGGTLDRTLMVHHLNARRLRGRQDVTYNRERSLWACASSCFDKEIVKRTDTKV